MPPNRQTRENGFGNLEASNRTMSRCLKFQELIREGQAVEAICGILKEYQADAGYTGAFFNLGLAFLSLGVKEIAHTCFTYYLQVDPEGFWALRAKEELAKISASGS